MRYLHGSPSLRLSPALTRVMVTSRIAVSKSAAVAIQTTSSVSQSQQAIRLSAFSSCLWLKVQRRICEDVFFVGAMQLARAISF